MSTLQNITTRDAEAVRAAALTAVLGCAAPAGALAISAYSITGLALAGVADAGALPSCTTV